MPTTLPERCAPSYEKESSFKSLASVTLLLVLAAFLSILVDLSAASQGWSAYPIDGQFYFSIATLHRRRRESGPASDVVNR